MSPNEFLVNFEYSEVDVLGLQVQPTARETHLSAKIQAYSFFLIQFLFCLWSLEESEWF